MTNLEIKLKELGAVDLLTLTNLLNTIVRQQEEAKLTAWRLRMPATTYQAGDKVIVPGVKNFDKVLKCTSGGKTGSGDFPKDYDSLTSGTSITDGTVKWLVAPLAEAGGAGGGGDHPVTSVNGKVGDVVLNSADVDAAPSNHTHDYLPLAGGTISGNIFSAQGNSTIFGGGTDTAKGGYLRVYTTEDEEFPGEVHLVVTDGTTYKKLRVAPSGLATWGGRNLVQKVNGHSADDNGNVSINSLQCPNYSSSVSLGDLSSYTATQDGWVHVHVGLDSQQTEISVNNTVVWKANCDWLYTSVHLPVKAGDVVKVENFYTSQMWFFPNR